MVRIPNIKIPSVRVGSIAPTSNIGVGGATPAPPTPITYLTQWRIVGNSEVHGNEIWSCGEYNPTDGKYHILVQPLGGNVADIALDEPLRKVNDVTDIINFPSDIEGKALVIRNLDNTMLSNLIWNTANTSVSNKYRLVSNTLTTIKRVISNKNSAKILSSMYETKPIEGIGGLYFNNIGIGVSTGGVLSVYDENYNQRNSVNAFIEHVNGAELIYELTAPTTELVDAPQIEEADSYSMVISQGAKAVSWSSFETDSE